MNHGLARAHFTTLSLVSALFFGCGAEAPAETTALDSEAQTAVPCPVVICGPKLAQPTTLAANVKPTSIALDTSNVYFTAITGAASSEIAAVPIAGGTKTVLRSGNFNAQSLGIHGSLLVWAQWTYNGNPPSGVFDMSTSGGSVTALSTLYDDVSAPQGLAVSAYDDNSPDDMEVYWGNAYKAQLYEFHQMPVPIIIFHTSLILLTTELLPQYTPSHTFYYPYSVVSDNVNVYFMTDGGTLYSVPLVGGGAPVQLTSGAAIYPLATDGANVYFVQNNAIMSIPVTGGATTTFANAGGTVSALNIHGTSLYWTCSTCGTVMKQALNSTTATTIASGQASPSCLAVDDSYTYWGTSNALLRFHN